jgi:hypothetical protein
LDPINLPNEKQKVVDMRGPFNKDKSSINVEDLFKEVADDMYP